MRRGTRRAAVMAVTGLVLAGTLAACSSDSTSTWKGASGSGRVLLVGTFAGLKGGYATIQAAVDAAHPGDWILIGPGDYHEDDDATASTSSATFAHGDHGGVVVTTPDLHLIGMNRSSVIVDGTTVGAPKPCDSDAQWQDLGPVAANGQPQGRNGIVVWKANDVTIDNLTVCNFLDGPGDSGNEIWWNGGDESGTIGLHGYWGSYLTATSTYFGNENVAASYGIFSSNSAGPAGWDEGYANNFNDSGMYVGACQQLCDVTIDHAWDENDALGYSGTNSGGAVVVENSRFDDNQDGFDTNTQIDADPPAPQNGNCPGKAISPITHTRSCWVFMHNDVYDNNNPNVPSAGSASQGPTGTGMTISGARNVTVMDNDFYDNGAWGILFVPYPDSGTPVLGQTCSGTDGFEVTGLGCVYDPQNDALLHNRFSDNGYFKNPSNADFGQITIGTGEPRNCFAGNVAPDGSAPPNLEQLQPTCGKPTTGPNTGGTLLAQVECDTGVGSCSTNANYPKATGVEMKPLPKLPTMPNPCQGVPSNPWCPGGRPA